LACSFLNITIISFSASERFLNAAEFRINLSKKNCDDLKRDKKSLEARALTGSGNVGNKKELCEGLIGFERDLRLQEEKLYEILIFSSQASAFAKNKVKPFLGIFLYLRF
jgi:hypothetical protein